MELFFINNEYLWLMQGLFTLVMLVDAARRGVEAWWYLVIFLVQPLGPWIYLGVVVLGTRRGTVAWRTGGSSGGWWKRRMSLDELRYRTKRTPTMVNHFTLAQRLMEKAHHDEALTHLKAAVELDPDYCPARYALAVCHHERGEAEQAVPHLEKIITHDRQWSNYRAWRMMITVRTAQGDKAAALVACRQVAKFMPTFEYKCQLAELLLANGQREEASKLMEQALEDYKFAPFGVRWRDRSWAKQAHKLWKQAAS